MECIAVAASLDPTTKCLKLEEEYGGILDIEEEIVGLNKNTACWIMGPTDRPSFLYFWTMNRWLPRKSQCHWLDTKEETFLIEFVKSEESNYYNRFDIHPRKDVSFCSTTFVSQFTTGKKRAQGQSIHLEVRFGGSRIQSLISCMHFVDDCTYEY